MGENLTQNGSVKIKATNKSMPESSNAHESKLDTIEKDLDKFLMSFKSDNTNKEDDLEVLLSTYLEESVKYRQLPRLTKKLIDLFKADTITPGLKLPLAFYTKYGEYLESYQVDIRCILDIWKMVNSTLIEKSRIKDDRVCRETLLFLNAILKRINLITIPLSLKHESMELLKQSEMFIFDYLLNLNQNEFIYHKSSNIVSKYLECCFNCGFLYIILCRFSISVGDHESTLSNSENNLNNVNRFLTILNNDFKLDEKLSKSRDNLSKCDYNIVFYLNKLQLLNVYAFGINGVIKIGQNDVENTLLNELFSIDLKAVQKLDLNSLLDNFNIESTIQDQQVYKVLHNKQLIFDNIHVIIPIVKNERKTLESCFRNLITMIYLLEKSDRTFLIYPVNSDIVFNDFKFYKQFEMAFLTFLKEINDKNNNEGKVFLEMLIDYSKCNTNDSDFRSLLERLSESKNSFYLNKNQTNALIRISKYFPIEHLNHQQSIAMFFLNEKIKIDRDTENFVLSTYFQLFKNSFFKDLPLSKFESWLFKFLSDFSDEKYPQDLIFEKILQKCFAFLLKHQFIENMIHFSNKIVRERSGNQMTNLVLIHIVEKISKILKIQSIDVKYSTHLTTILENITTYLIDEKSIQTDNEKFLLCSILIRHICSGEEGQNLTKNNEKMMKYFKALFNDCQKMHKTYRKNISKNKKEDNESILFIPYSYVEFLKAIMLYNNQLKQTIDSKDDYFKIAFEAMFELYLKNEKIQIMKKFCEKKESGEDNSFIIRTLTYIIKNLSSTQQFEIVSSLFMRKLKDVYENDDYCSYFVKLANIFKILCRDHELNDEIKGMFSSFLQKIFLVQLPTIIGQINADSEFQSLFSLLNAANDIYGSKYYLFPSHLVISTLQWYNLLDIENYKIENAVEINELLCKLISIIIARYSKKFRSTTGVVSSILIKMINSTINVSNQLNLTSENIHLAVRMAKNLERIVAQLSAFKKYFNRQSPYILSEYFHKMTTLSINTSVKSVLSEMIFNMIHLCDLHGISMLNMTLPNGPKELFKTSFVEYKRFYKYTGKV